MYLFMIYHKDTKRITFQEVVSSKIYNISKLKDLYGENIYIEFDYGYIKLEK